VIVSNLKVSSLHCELKKSPEYLEIHDSSSNGTYVNNLKIGKGNSSALKDGDEVLIINDQDERLGWKLEFPNPLKRQRTEEVKEE